MAVQTATPSYPDLTVPVQNSAFLYMDAARALLAGAVAFGHAWVLIVRDYVPTDDRVVQALYGLAGFAHPAVIMFFVLSGYWITRSVLGRSERGWSWSGYMADRLGRLLPVLIPALVLGGMLDWMALRVLHSPTHLGLTGSWVLHKSVGADLSFTTLIGNLLFLQGILVHGFGSNEPLWSLAAEAWFYLWFPALYLSMRSRRPGWALLTLLPLLVAPRLGVYFLTWLAGALVFMLAERMTVWPRAGRAALAAAGAVLLMVLLWARLDTSAARDLVLALSFAALLLATIAVRPAVLPGVRRLARLGARSSFSLYVIHFPVIAFAAALTVGRERLAPTPQNLLVVGLTLAATVALAIAFSTVTETRTPVVRGWLARLFRVTSRTRVARETNAPAR